MTLTVLTKEDFRIYSESINSRSFLQSTQMGELLEKRGATVTYLALKHTETIQVAAMVYSLPMTGGLHMEINSGPIYSNATYLKEFYKDLQAYAKQHGVLELIVKPYDTFQSFDSNGNPVTEEQQEIIHCLTNQFYFKK